MRRPVWGALRGPGLGSRPAAPHAAHQRGLRGTLRSSVGAGRRPTREMLRGVLREQILARQPWGQWWGRALRLAQGDRGSPRESTRQATRGSGTPVSAPMWSRGPVSQEGKQTCSKVDMHALKGSSVKKLSPTKPACGPRPRPRPGFAGEVSGLDGAGPWAPWRPAGRGPEPGGFPAQAAPVGGKRAGGSLAGPRARLERRRRGQHAFPSSEHWPAPPVGLGGVGRAWAACERSAGSGAAAAASRAVALVM